MAVTQEERNKWLICGAVRKLLRTVPLHKIKIEDIMSETGLSQQVFYRCFKDRNDLIQFCFKETNDQTIVKLGEGQDWKKTVCEKLTDMAMRKSEFVGAFEVFDFRGYLQSEVDVSIAVYKKLFEKNMHQKADSDISFLISAFSHAAVAMSAEWIRGGMLETPEHLTDLLLETMPVKLREKLGLN